MEMSDGAEIVAQMPSWRPDRKIYSPRRLSSATGNGTGAAFMNGWPNASMIGSVNRRDAEGSERIPRPQAWRPPPRVTGSRSG